MGRIIRYLDREIWGVFANIFRCHQFDNGELFLGPGVYQITVPTSVALLNVWLRVVEDDSMPVCQGEETMVGASPNGGGFVLFAKIANWAKIEWFATSYEAGAR